jgi:hypothetical protein
MKIAALSLLAFVVIGCQSIQTRTYDVNVKNDSAKPITIWLTKNGPAWESGWKSPEDIAIESPKANEKIAGVVVPAGKTASTGKMTGKFAPNVDAILRIYLGQQTFNELLAINQDSPDRIDFILRPGRNDVLVTDDGSGVKASRTGP